MYLNKLLEYYAFVGKKIVPHFFRREVIFTNYKIIYISLHGSSIVYQQIKCLAFRDVLN